MYTKNEHGQALLVVVVFMLFLSLAIGFGLLTPIITDTRLIAQQFTSAQSIYVAEAGVEDVVYRLRNSMNFDSTELLKLAGATATTTVSDVGDEQKKVRTQGQMGKVVRASKADVLVSSGTSFNFGAQAGVEGFDIRGGSTLNGNVYSNGNVTGAGGSEITGSAIAVSTIEGEGGSQWWQPLVVSEDSWADTVITTRTNGTLYCDTSIDNYPPPDGTPCDTSQGTPQPADFPISDSAANAWKEEAESGGTISGDVSVGWAGDTLGPKKITGNLTIGGGGVLTLTGTVWVVGDVSVGGGGSVELDSSYGNQSGVLITDGQIDIGGGGEFKGSGELGSYPVLVTTSTCPDGSGCSGPALSLSGGSGAVVLVAQNGTLFLNGGSAARAITGKRVEMSGGGEVNYDAGLVSLFFTSGPGGTWSIDEWKEVE